MRLTKRRIIDRGYDRVYVGVTIGGVIMKFVSVRDLRGKSSEVWKDLSREREMVITSNGRPIAILAATSESTFEESISALRTARAIDAVSSLQRRSIVNRTNTISPSEIDREIKSARKQRRQ